MYCKRLVNQRQLLSNYFFLIPTTDIQRLFYCSCSNVALTLLFLLLCICARQIASLELECSESSYNWCYIEKPISLANGEPVTISNAAAYQDAERLETFSSGNITEIPAEFFKIFTKLKYIRLSTGGNGITTINPKNFKYAKHLKVLNLISNNIKNVPKAAFDAAPHLTQIILKFNAIDEVSEYAFANLEELQTLYLSYNHIKYLKRDVFAGASNINELALDNNQISLIDDGALDMPQLRILSLNNNRILSLSNRLFAQMPIVQNIDLSTNSIKTIPPSFFRLPAEYIKLSNNNLLAMNIHSFSAMSNLRVLELAATNIQLDDGAKRDVHDNYVQIHSDLDILDLSHNNLSDADILRRLTVFKRLRYLILDDNHFAIVNDIHKVTESMPFIRGIRLRGNELEQSVMDELSTTKHVNVVV